MWNIYILIILGDIRLHISRLGIYFSIYNLLPSADLNKVADTTDDNLLFFRFNFATQSLIGLYFNTVNECSLIIIRKVNVIVSSSRETKFLNQFSLS